MRHRAPSSSVRRGGWLPVALVALSLGVLYGPSLAAHAARAADPFYFHDDAPQHVVPFLRYGDVAAASRDDYAADYYLACLPIGYRGLFSLGAVLWDPIALSKVLPYAGLLAVLLGVGAAAARLGGAAAAWGAMALCLSADVYLDRMGGSTARIAAFPLLAGAVAALAAGRCVALAALVCLAGAFYPAMAVVCGLTLAIVLLLLPAGDRGTAAGWPLRRRIAVLATTAVLTAVVVLPTMLSCRQYGRLLSADDVAAYPECGPEGRYGPADRPPFVSLPRGLAVQAFRALVSSGTPFAPQLRAWGLPHPTDPRFVSRITPALAVMLGVVCLGFVPAAVRDAGARRLLALLLAASLGYLASRFLAPHLYLPQRYLAYPLPILVTVALPVAIATIARMPWRGGDRWPLVSCTAAFALSALGLALIGGRIDPEVGLRPHVPYRIYDVVRSLPPDALIAGWPSGLVNDLPYLGRRRALVTLETHQAFHLGYAEEMRRRMRALIDAYFATTHAPLARLRDAFGVTHLLVDTTHYGATPPPYFAPFDDWTRAAHAAARSMGAEVVRQFGTAGVFSEDRYVLLDLRRLAPSPAEQSGP